MGEQAGGRRSTGWSVWAGWWPERIASFAALAGLLYAVMSGFHVRSWQGSGSDMKTVYGAAWRFTRGLPAYSFGDLAQVFAQQHVVAPDNWYAHAAVYPPFTLGVMWPLTLLPMVQAVYAWVILSGLLMAFATAALVRFEGDPDVAGPQLSRSWRLLTIALIAASPLLSFGLEVGNVSVSVAALCLLAVIPGARPTASGAWMRAAGLGLALLLKPHLALWVVLALLLLRDRGGRLLALRASLLAAASAAVLLLVATAMPAGSQIGSYRNMLHAEISSGSMNAGNRELIGVAAQITSLESLIGYFVPSAGAARGLAYGLLLCLVSGLVWASVRMRPSETTRLLIIAAWCGLGMIATYHRAADGTVLFLLLPWLMTRLRTRFYDGLAWAVLVLSVVMSCEATWEYWEALALKPHFHHIAPLVLYRQASMGAVALSVLLMGILALAAGRRKRGIEFAEESSVPSHGGAVSLEWRVDPTASVGRR